MNASLRLAQELIAVASLTPLDGPQEHGCMDIVARRLAPLGFAAHWLPYGEGSVGPDARVRNLWLKRTGTHPEGKTLVLAGHTDVVPTGPLEQWSTPPFSPTVREGKLYGRGAADMKTSIACFVTAIEEFLAHNPNPTHSIALLLTSDEEGPSIHGTVRVCEWLHARGERLHWCVVGEPTSVHTCGDMIKNGRRGTMSGKLTVHGIQGHIAYAQLAKNPVHMLAPALAALTRTVWDRGNAHFEPTSFQVSNIHAGTGALNVIAQTCVVDMNFRFNTESSTAALQQRVQEVLQANALLPEDYTLEWTVGGEPFLSSMGDLVQATREAIYAQTGAYPALSTTGGTSDARFIARICPEVIELGPTNATIHKIDECVPLADIEPLRNIYQRVIARLCA